MGMIPFGFMSDSFKKIISGIDGDLVIISGQTVDIAEGSVKQYNSIRIDSGGVLRITGNLGLWTEIGCRNNCLINGSIISKAGYSGQSTHSGGIFTKQSEFNLGLLTYSIVQTNGANGAKGGGFYGGLGGTQSLGIGGGGGGGASVSSSDPGTGEIGKNGTNGTFLSGGNGGNGNIAVFYSSAIPGGIGGGGSGGKGAYSNSEGMWYGTGGGGGGYKGHHGKGLVLYVEEEISGIGSISCSGENGFGGGSGGTSNNSNYKSGGIGGGGAGGSGGRLLVYYRFINETLSPNLSANKGIKGINGSFGNTLNSTIAQDGIDGNVVLQKIG
jgi:hypothetical protein